MRDAVIAFGVTSMLFAPFLGAVIIVTLTEKIYQKYPIKKSLYFKAKNLKDEIDDNIVVIYCGTYIVSLLAFLICCYGFGLTGITAIIIFDTWQIVFTIVLYHLAVNYIKRTYGQAFYEYQSIKF